MQKNNYFERLEELSSLCVRAVYISSASTRPLIQSALREIKELQEQATDKICELEFTLFDDFLPPLERQSIAEAAHAMGRIIEKCYCVIFQKSQRSGYDKKIKVSDSCIALSELIDDAVSLLKKIKKPNQAPKILEFRKALLAARQASRTPQKRQGSACWGLNELREELSRCFDKIIEIMLCNI